MNASHAHTHTGIPSVTALGPALLVRYAPLAARHLRTTAPDASTMTGRMAAYHMGWVDRDGRPDDGRPGKLVRPSLCLWACEAAGGRLELALPLASAVEWAHNGTLVHDDIQDADRERRHRETVWSVWGASSGIDTGDAILALAFEVLLAPGQGPGRRLRAGRVLGAAIHEVVEGQCLDRALEGRLGASPAAYLRMARAKTGALFGACLEGGAMIGGAPVAVGRRLRRAGQLLGLAFQVRDDWLGIWGEPAQTGKSRDGDLGRRKVTYPVVAGCAAMTNPERRRFRALFTAGDASVVAAMRELLERRGADRLTAEAAERLAEEAVAQVATCGFGGRATEEFSELAGYVAARER
ncbi:MAG TPA: polyprenyl synthetase family protein [Candidatus Dormibacteraeota bacterium]|nr:polyprenyl synthetase family protein [Candidatus Dormibacteraeota bacterium]